MDKYFFGKNICAHAKIKIVYKILTKKCDSTSHSIKMWQYKNRFKRRNLNIKGNTTENTRSKFYV